MRFYFSNRGVQLGHKQVECDLKIEVESSHNDEASPMI